MAVCCSAFTMAWQFCLLRGRYQLRCVFENFMPVIFFKALFMAALLGASISTQSWLRCSWGIRFTVTIVYGFGIALLPLAYMGAGKNCSLFFKF